MIRKKTVFILGAGSSHEVKMPLGESLCNLVADTYDWRSSIHPRLYRAISTARESPIGSIESNLKHAEFLWEQLPGQRSIDNFLHIHSDNTHLTLLGKMGIVKCILEAEAGSLLAPMNNLFDTWSAPHLNKTWFSKFFDILHTDVEKKNIENIFENVQIINFNYDRCLEVYLVQKIQSLYAIPRIEAERIVGKLIIHRPYGKVGSLPWQKGENKVSFGDASACVFNLSKEINTYTEGFRDHQALGAMKDCLHETTYIVFLGFGFHKQNMDLLKYSCTNYDTEIFATTYRSPKATVPYIKSTLTDMTDDAIRGNQIHLEDLSCQEFCNDYFMALTS